MNRLGRRGAPSTSATWRGRGNGSTATVTPIKIHPHVRLNLWNPKVCPYGPKCTKTNPSHFKAFSHPFWPDLVHVYASGATAETGIGYTAEGEPIPGKSPYLMRNGFDGKDGGASGSLFPNDTGGVGGAAGAAKPRSRYCLSAAMLFHLNAFGLVLIVVGAITFLAAWSPFVVAVDTLDGEDTTWRRYSVVVSSLDVATTWAAPCVAVVLGVCAFIRLCRSGTSNEMGAHTTTVRAASQTSAADTRRYHLTQTTMTVLRAGVIVWLALAAQTLSTAVSDSTASGAQCDPFRRVVVVNVVRVAVACDELESYWRPITVGVVLLCIGTVLQLVASCIAVCVSLKRESMAQGHASVAQHTPQQTHLIHDMYHRSGGGNNVDANGVGGVGITTGNNAQTMMMTGVHSSGSGGVIAGAGAAPPRGATPMMPALSQETASLLPQSSSTLPPMPAQPQSLMPLRGGDVGERLMPLSTDAGRTGGIR